MVQKRQVRVKPAQASVRERLVHEGVEVVDAILALGRKAALAVDPRREAALHVLADYYVLLLYLVTESDRLLHTLPGFPSSAFVEVPLKDGERLIVAHRQDDVRGHIVG